MESIPSNHPLRRLFCGLVEQTFCTEVGLCDPNLTEYLSDLLVTFTHVDRLSTIRRARGEKLEQVAAMLIAMSDDLPREEPQRDRRLYRNIGDYALFWAGVYPEHLQRTGRESDELLDYIHQGKESYARVSELLSDNEQPPASLFRHLSEEFEYCAYGLGLVRRGWEESQQTPGSSSGDLII